MGSDACWLYEQGIGENRAILVEDGAIVEASIEIPLSARVGGIHEARLAGISAGRRAIVKLEDGGEALLEPVPAGLTEGQAIRVEIVREAIPERGREKLPRCRLSDLPPRDGPGLLDRISAGPWPVITPPAHGADCFEQAGWSELLEEAATGEIAFPGGGLRLSLTPAMTLFDVDGDLPPAQLAAAGAAAAARAIRRMGIGGSIGIDLPTMAAREDRQRAAAALDGLLPQPFERTAVNGFGFLQVVRRRERASLPELVQQDPAGAAARALLRRAERASGSGDLVVSAAPALIARVEAETGWLEQLQRRAGCLARMRADPALRMAGGHVQREAS